MDLPPSSIHSFSLMPRPKKAAAPKSESSAANLGLEANLWRADDKLRNNMDAAEYKHVVLGLMFLVSVRRSASGRVLTLN